MTRISRYLKPEVKSSLIKEFWYTLGILNRQEMEIFWKDILSPTEILMLAKRLEILKQIRNKYRYQDIKANIRVTEATIARVSEKLHKDDKNFLSILDRLIKNEKRRHEDFLESRKPHWRGKLVFGK